MRGPNWDFSQVVGKLDGNWGMYHFMGNFGEIGRFTDAFGSTKFFVGYGSNTVYSGISGDLNIKHGLKSNDYI